MVRADEKKLCEYAHPPVDTAAFNAEYKKEFPNATQAELGSAITYYSNIDPSVFNAKNKTGTKASEALGSAVRGGRELIRSQTSFGPSANVAEEFISLDKASNIFFDEHTGKLKESEEIVDSFLSESGSQLLLQLKQQSDLQGVINQKTGITGELSKGFRDEITKAYPSAVRLGFSFGELAESMGQLLADSGRFKLVSQETIERIALTSRVFFDSLADGVASIAEFQKVSRGAYDAMEAVDKIGKSSLEIGLNAKETTKTLVSNVDRLNSFGFRNGIEGLTRMVQKAQSLRMDLGTAFKLADDVMDPDKALSLSANLQVIGGAIGDLNDPIKMMWMATNNVEGLQDALVGSLETLVSFNQESGTFEIVGADLRRLRAMATELGMDYQQLGNTAVQAAQRSSASFDLMSSSLVLDEKQKEFFTNMAQMRGGRMVIEIPQSLRESIGLKQDETNVALEDMSQKQADILIEQQKAFEKMSVEDIARQQVSVLENVGRDVSFIAASLRVSGGKSIEELLKVLGYDPLAAIKESKKASDFLAKQGLTIIDFTKEKIKEGYKTVSDEMKSYSESRKETKAEVSSEKNETKKSKEVESKEIDTKSTTANFDDVIKYLSNNNGNYKDEKLISELIGLIKEIKPEEKILKEGKTESDLIRELLISNSKISETDKINLQTIFEEVNQKLSSAVESSTGQNASQQSSVTNNKEEHVVNKSETHNYTTNESIKYITENRENIEVKSPDVNVKLAGIENKETQTNNGLLENYKKTNNEELAGIAQNINQSFDKFILGRDNSIDKIGSLISSSNTDSKFKTEATKENTFVVEENTKVVLGLKDVNNILFKTGEENNTNMASLIGTTKGLAPSFIEGQKSFWDATMNKDKSNLNQTASLISSPISIDMSKKEEQISNASKEEEKNNRNIASNELKTIEHIHVHTVRMPAGVEPYFANLLRKDDIVTSTEKRSYVESPDNVLVA